MMLDLGGLFESIFSVGFFGWDFFRGELYRMPDEKEGEINRNEDVNFELSKNSDEDKNIIDGSSDEDKNKNDGSSDEDKVMNDGSSDEDKVMNDGSNEIAVKKKKLKLPEKKRVHGSLPDTANYIRYTVNRPALGRNGFVGLTPGGKRRKTRRAKRSRKTKKRKQKKAKQSRRRRRSKKINLN